MSVVSNLVLVAALELTLVASDINRRCDFPDTNTWTPSPPRHCKDIQSLCNVTGTYDIYPEISARSVQVLCDMETDGGGWTVFQKRQDGSVDFNVTWIEYKNGFGNVDGEFWLGNDILYQLTSYTSQELRIDMEDWDGNTSYANYALFGVADENEKYNVTLGEFVNGDAGDGIKNIYGLAFSTKDQDNDEHETRLDV